MLRWIVIAPFLALATGCAHLRPLHTAPALSVQELPAVPGGLPGYRVLERSSGTEFQVHYDSASKATAVSNLPVLAAMYRDLAEMAGVEASRVAWFAIAFVHDTLSNRLRAGDAVIWPVHVRGPGLSPAGRYHLFFLVPHEQTHAIQTIRSDLPRWFTEGHAEWQALRWAERVRPDVAETRKAELARARALVAQSPRLSAWNAVVRVKREAFLRNATPEQRERMQRDPTYTPPGPYRFGPEDFEVGGDIGSSPDVLARYAAAAAVFDEISRTAGERRMRLWLQAVWRQQHLSPDRVIDLAREFTGVELMPYLR